MSEFFDVHSINDIFNIPTPHTLAYLRLPSPPAMCISHSHSRVSSLQTHYMSSPSLSSRSFSLCLRAVAASAAAAEQKKREKEEEERENILMYFLLISVSNSDDDGWMEEVRSPLKVIKNCT